MKSLIIDYDLCNPGRNYEDLYETIKKCPRWARITESTWFVKTDLTCVELRNALQCKMDKNDRIFVGELSGCAAWSNVKCDDEYLKNNL